jgi:SAM-dependent methyltransferase
MPADLRYDRFGWDYAIVNPPDERALPWIRGHARETGGPILELACGTGPMLPELAADGYDVVGLDYSAAMLGLAQQRLADVPQEAVARVGLVQGDMREFELDRSFALAFVADNSLREVESLEGVLATLRCIRRHLRPEGRLLVAERRFDESRYPGGVAEWPWSKPLSHPKTGALVRRRIRVRFDKEQRRLHGVMTYRTLSPDGTDGGQDEALPFESPVLEPAEYLDLFKEAGFDARLSCGYGTKPDDGADPILNFVAMPAGTGHP